MTRKTEWSVAAAWRMVCYSAVVALACGCSSDDDPPTGGTTYLVSISASGTGSGTVVSQGAVSPAINCTVTNGTASGACSGVYQSGMSLSLVATASGGGTFSGWSGACSGAAACTVVVSQNQTLSVAFAAPIVNVPLSVVIAGAGSGTVTSAPTGVACTTNAGSVSGTCNATFVQGTQVTLTAAPAGGSTFVSWGGACSGAGPCSLSLQSAQNVTATFALPSFALVVGVTGNGTGTVTSAPAGVNCSIATGTPAGTCTATYAQGTSVTLTATPAAGFKFNGWSGDCSGTGTCVVQMSAARNVSANFVPNIVTFGLDVSIGGSGNGSITSSPTGITCSWTASATSGTCSAQFNQNTNVVLTAAPAAGSNFGGWGGACGASGTSLTCTVSMSQARTVTALFAPVPAQSFGLSVRGAGNGNGKVTSSQPNTAINCTVSAGVAQGTCSQTYLEGTVVTLQAAASAGSQFVGWQNGGTNPTLVTTVSGAREVTAQFDIVAPTRYSVTFTVSMNSGTTGSGSMTGTNGIPQDAASFTVSYPNDKGPKSITISYPAGTVLTLRGTAFANWFSPSLSGCTSAVTTEGSSKSCTVTVDSNKSVAVSF